jgi:hypothetical protein
MHEADEPGILRSDKSPHDAQDDDRARKIAEPAMHPQRLVGDPVDEERRCQQPVSRPEQRVPDPDFDCLHACFHICRSQRDASATRADYRLRISLPALIYTLTH